MRIRTALGYGATCTAVLAVALLGWGAGMFGIGSGGAGRSQQAVAVWVAGQPSAEDPAGAATSQAATPSPTQATTGPTTTAAGGTQPLLHANPVTITAPGFWSWSLLDRGTGVLTGSDNAGQAQSTASMIKAWLAADLLRLTAEQGSRPSSATLRQLSIMIRDSDNAAATATYRRVGGTASITRLIRICGLTDSRAGSDWSQTMISARDAVRMGACLADGRAAGTAWTDWVLTEMRSVRGTGRFGIIEALPSTEAAQTAIKNGWISRKDGNWHVNCLAVAPTWILAVETVYPTTRGMATGAATCRSVAQQLMAQLP